MSPVLGLRALMAESIINQILVQCAKDFSAVKTAIILIGRCTSKGAA